MDSPPTSRVRFLDTAGNPIARPQEWTPAMLEVLVEPEQRHTVKLWRQGDSVVPYLKTLRGRERILADWPRSDVGRYRLRLDIGEASEEFEFTIWPQKIAPESYRYMLEDLQTRLPVSVVLALSRLGGLAGVKLPPPGANSMAQDLWRLKRAIRGTKQRPGLASALPEISRDPHRMLRTEEVWVRAERARRPSPARLALAYSVGQNLTHGGRPVHVVDSRVEHTVDVYENRLVKVFWSQVNGLLRRLSILASSGLHEELAGELHTLHHDLREARRRSSFLDEVNVPSHLPTRLSMVLAKRAPYRAALEGYLDFHKSVSVKLDDPALDAPLENLPYLYQLWGTLEVLTALQQVGEEYGYMVVEHNLARRDDNSLYVRVLPNGKPALILAHPSSGTEVRLIPERTYGTSKSKHEKSDHRSLHSISYQQRPDVAIEVTKPGAKTRVYLFDPKYKLWGEALSTDTSTKIYDAYDESGYEEVQDLCKPMEDSVISSISNSSDNSSRPTKVDIDKMHAYRDSIRDGVGKRVVEYAAVLYPGQYMTYAGVIEALRAVPGAEAELHDRLVDVIRRALITE